MNTSTPCSTASTIATSNVAAATNMKNKNNKVKNHSNAIRISQTESDTSEASVASKVSLAAASSKMQLSTQVPTTTASAEANNNTTTRFVTNKDLDIVMGSVLQRQQELAEYLQLMAKMLNMDIPISLSSPATALASASMLPPTAGSSSSTPTPVRNNRLDGSQKKPTAVVETRTKALAPGQSRSEDTLAAVSTASSLQPSSSMANSIRDAIASVGKSAMEKNAKKAGREAIEGARTQTTSERSHPNTKGGGNNAKISKKSTKSADEAARLAVTYLDVLQKAGPGSTIVPCRARGLPRNHNAKTAYFVLCKGLKHGEVNERQ